MSEKTETTNLDALFQNEKTGITKGKSETPKFRFVDGTDKFVAQYLFQHSK